MNAFSCLDWTWIDAHSAGFKPVEVGIEYYLFGNRASRSTRAATLGMGIGCDSIAIPAKNFQTNNLKIIKLTTIFTPMFLQLLILATSAIFSSAAELTFELPDNANQCFYEEIKKGVDCVLEFQVVTGGQYDVDVVLEDPNGKILYKELKKQLDSHSYKTEMDGTYKVCFSNEFSTFSHKVVYMDWNVGGPEFVGMPTPRVGTGVTQMERSVETIADRLRIMDDYQTHHRLREATGRKRAEDLNERVTYWSIGQTAIVVLIGVGQVLLLRSFFADRKTGY